MKKITELTINKLRIDPSIELQDTLDEMVRQLKIDVISYKDDEESILNIYYTMKTYFNDAVIAEILTTSLTEEEIKRIDREYKLENVLKK